MTDVWATLFKVLLVAFIAVGVVVFVVVYVRKSRTVRFRAEPDPTLGPLSQMGVVAPTPLPEWAYWDEEDRRPDDPETSDR